LIAYTESASDLITDYLRLYFDDWKIPDDVRSGGARLAIVDSDGTVLGEPVDVAALGAPFPVEINHLVVRPGGLGWAYLDGPGGNEAKVVHFECRKS